MGTVSSLANNTILAHESNYTKGRNGYKICKITPHIMAGVLTGEQCARNIFGNPNRNASANYCIGNEGDIVCNVEEENRAWTSSNRTNDYQAITIEVSNSSTGGKWPISDVAWNSLVALCVDICKRYNFRLTYDGTPNGSLTRHNMFKNTSCPGPYLQGRFQELADTVNARLDEQTVVENANVGGKPTVQTYTYKDFVGDVQRACGAKVDFIAGPETLSKTVTVSKSKNRKHAVVRPLQRYLNALGFDCGAVDGIAGKLFDNAVKSYQRANGCVCDGEITARNKTWKKLLKLA